jgi:hypothetical protein
MNYLSKLGGGYQPLHMPKILLLLIFGLSLGLHLVSCNKLKETNTQTSTTGSVVERTDLIPFTPLTKTAIAHNSTEDYEFIGRTLYEHRMYFSDRDPSSYFNFSPKETAAMAVADAEFNSKYKDLETPEEIIKKMYQEGLISSENEFDYLVSYFNQLISMAEAIENNVGTAGTTDFGTFYFDLINLETAVQQNANLTDDQKFNILTYSAIVRNDLKYMVSSGLVEERGLRCFGGIKIKCWLKYGFETYLKIQAYQFIIGAILISTGAVVAVTGGVGLVLTPKIALYLAGYALLIRSAIVDFNDKIRDRDCKCGDGDGEPLFACNKPDGIVIQTTPCSDIVTLKAIGFGVHLLQYQWSLDLTKVVAVDYPGEAQPITDEPTLRVQLVAPAQTADVGVKLIGCADPATDQFTVVQELPIAAAYSAPGTLLISGPDPGIVDWIQTYSLAGTAAASPNGPFTINLLSGPGTVLQNQGNSIKIEWYDVGNATLRGTVTTCTGPVLTVSKNIQVKTKNQ